MVMETGEFNKMKWRIIACIACLCIFLSACGNSSNQETVQQSSNTPAQQIQTSQNDIYQNSEIESNKEDLSTKVAKTISEPFLKLTLGDVEPYSIGSTRIPTEQRSIISNYEKGVKVGDIETFELSFISSISADVISYIENNGGYYFDVTYNNCEPYYEETATTLSYNEFDNSYIYFPNDGRASVTIDYGFDNVRHSITLDFNVEISNVKIGSGIGSTPNNVVQIENGTVVLTGVGYGDYKTGIFVFNEEELVANGTKFLVENGGQSKYYIKNAKENAKNESICSIENTIYYSDSNKIYSMDLSLDDYAEPTLFYEGPTKQYYSIYPRNMFSIGNYIYIIYDYYYSGRDYKGSEIVLIGQDGKQLNNSVYFSDLYNLTYYKGNIYIAGKIGENYSNLYRVDLNLMKFKQVEPNSYFRQGDLPTGKFYIVDGFTYYGKSGWANSGIYRYEHNSGEDAVNLTIDITKKGENPSLVTFIYHDGYVYYLFTNDYMKKGIYYYKLDLISGESTRLGMDNNIRRGEGFSANDEQDVILNICGDYLYFFTVRGLKQSTGPCFIYRYNIERQDKITDFGIYSR